MSEPQHTQKCRDERGLYCICTPQKPAEPVTEAQMVESALLAEEIHNAWDALFIAVRHGSNGRKMIDARERVSRAIEAWNQALAATPTQAPAGEVLALREALTEIVAATNDGERSYSVRLHRIEATANKALDDTAPAAEAAIAEVEKPWREAFVYAQHFDMCALNQRPRQKAADCTCGFSEILHTLLTKPTDHDEGEGK